MLNYGKINFKEFNPGTIYSLFYMNGFLINVYFLKKIIIDTKPLLELSLNLKHRNITDLCGEYFSEALLMVAENNDVFYLTYDSVMKEYCLYNVNYILQKIIKTKNAYSFYFKDLFLAKIT